MATETDNLEDFEKGIRIGVGPGSHTMDHVATRP